MMSPKTKLIVGGVGAAAVTSSLVVSSVALGTQWTKPQIEKVIEEKPLGDQPNNDLVNKLNQLEAKIPKDLEIKEYTDIKGQVDQLQKSVDKLTSDSSEDKDYQSLGGKITTLEEKLTGIETNIEKIPKVDLSNNEIINELSTRLNNLSTEVSGQKTNQKNWEKFKTDIETKFGGLKTSLEEDKRNIENKQAEVVAQLSSAKSHEQNAKSYSDSAQSVLRNIKNIETDLKASRSLSTTQGIKTWMTGIISSLQSLQQTLKSKGITVNTSIPGVPAALGGGR